VRLYCRSAMVRRMANLSAAQRVFVSVWIETGSPSKAERESGLPAATTADLRIQRAARDALASRLLSIAPRALGVLESLMTDSATPPAVRRLAASDLLDRVGLVSHAALALARPVESLSDMPARELRALVERLETELFARAKPVTDLEIPAPHDAPAQANGLSVLD
jgi:hypothetical protein